MFISNQQVNSIIKAYDVANNQKNRTVQPTKSVRRGDSLLLSPEARTRQRFKVILRKRLMSVLTW